MNKKKDNVLRIKNIIENDRLNLSDNFDELILNDLKKLLKDYFDIIDGPKLVIEKLGDRYKVNIEIISSRIKSFGILPK